MSAVSRLEDVGILAMNSNAQLFRQVYNIIMILVPNVSTYTRSTSLYKALYAVFYRLPPTWKNLLLAFRLLNLNDLAQRMEIYLSGATDREEKHSGMIRSKSDGE